jgi:two-component system nitrate/nitrite response regulator NarL
MSQAVCQPGNALRVLIADRNRMSSQLLAESLGRDPHFEVAAVAPATDILSVSARGKADVAVISAELDSGPRKGMHVARCLSGRSAHVSIVILLDALERDEVVASFRNGAKGVFCRTEPLSEFCKCIESVSQGRIWAGSVEAEYLLEAVRGIPSCDAVGQLRKLTRRETTTAELAAQGLSNKQIANRLGLSEHTIKNYLFHIFEKLSVSNRIELLLLLVNGHTYQDSELKSRLPIEGQALEPAFVKAAEDGLLAAQLILGWAHLEGKGLEQSDRKAYYWLRMAELTSLRTVEQGRSTLAELKRRLAGEEIQELEQRVSQKIQDDWNHKLKRATQTSQPLTGWMFRRAG